MEGETSISKVLQKDFPIGQSSRCKIQVEKRNWLDIACKKMCCNILKNQEIAQFDKNTL